MADSKDEKIEERGGATGKVVLFVVLAVVWVLADHMAKQAFAGQKPGGVLAGPFAGLIDFRLVHNTGGAWGIFSNSTVALGVLSVVVCAILAVYFFVCVKKLNLAETVGLALVVGGGIGNAIDRFTQGFVTDFIEFSFFDFPVFNIADIGVTCGFVLIFLGLLVGYVKERNR